MSNEVGEIKPELTNLEQGATVAIAELGALLRYVNEHNYMDRNDARASVLNALRALTNGLGHHNGFF